MTIKTALDWANQKLQKTSVSSALDAEVLLSFVLDKTKGYIYANLQKTLAKFQVSSFKKFIRKRARYWPIAYLTGHKEFFGLDFIVTRNVLIPRPETELLVELALEILKARSYHLKGVIDLGTGSGNIIISLAVILSGAKNLNFYAIDSSQKALKIAHKNARRHGVLKKIKFLRGNLLSRFFENWKLEIGNFLIIANLPYLTPSQYSGYPDLKHEPRQALVGGKDGLKYFRNLFKQLQKFYILNFEFCILLEHSPTQKPALAKLAKKYFPGAKITFHKDLAGRWRAVKIQTKFKSRK